MTEMQQQGKERIKNKERSQESKTEMDRMQERQTVRWKESKTKAKADLHMEALETIVIAVIIFGMPPKCVAVLPFKSDSERTRI